MQGTYVIKQNGVEIARSKNLITLEGQKIMAAYMAGAAPSWAGSIAIGAGTVAADTADLFLNLEFAREPVLSKSVVFGGGLAGTHRVVVKANIPASIAGVIYELGIFSIENSTAAVSPSAVIAGIFPSDDWELYSGGSWVNVGSAPDTTYFRVGTDAPTLSSAGTTKFRINIGSTDFSMYSGVDKFSFSGYYITGSVSAAALIFYTDDSNYFTYSPTVSDLIGSAVGTYTVLRADKSNWTAVGNPLWSEITSIGIDITGTADVCIDAIRVDDADSIDPNYALVSRSVLTTPVVKSAGSEMDIEYYLDI